MASKNLCDKTVTVNGVEFIDICRKMIKENSEWDSYAYISAVEQFNLLSSMEKSRYGWFHKYSNSLFFFAGICVLLWTIKCVAGNHWEVKSVDYSTNIQRIK